MVPVARGRDRGLPEHDQRRDQKERKRHVGLLGRDLVNKGPSREKD